MSRAEDLWNRLETDGLGAIDGFIADRTSEYLFLDFKRSADDGAGTSVHNNDRENLSKAISGFGNSDGGLWYGASIVRKIQRVRMSQRPSIRSLTRLGLLRNSRV
jgi:hypothetical protein